MPYKENLGTIIKLGWGFFSSQFGVLHCVHYLRPLSVYTQGQLYTVLIIF